ncbi:MAG TPA: enoyl-CoA hydratase/isomerase family protein [Dehalococcoidia bacterium]|nr:enoyl-CoA hydratase/isomerase family protein [Dehalococcoidia bacterium]
MELETVIYEKKNNIGLVTLNRPQVLNAMNHQMWQDLSRVLDNVENDDGIKVMVITGITTEKGKKAFSTGADLKDSKERTVDEYRAYLKSLQGVSLRIIKFPKPTIAAINGYALGSGYELALACDLRIAANDALIGSPEARVSSTVTGGATRLIIELVGLGKAKELLFTAEYITGSEAERIGLVNKAVPADKLMATTFEMAEKIVQNSNLSIRLIKNSLDIARKCSPEEMMDYEVEACLQTVFAPQRREALQRFEDRKK